MRIGHGYDVHRLVKGRALIIGGVKIEHETGLLGHSDADVLTHAIIDSLLGAACLGDIGAHFPDSELKFKNANSLLLLEATVSLIKENGYGIVNIDSTIVAQAPKLAPYIPLMRERLSISCGIPLNCLSVKATTEESLGFSGRKEGISATSVCLLRCVL